MKQSANASVQKVAAFITRDRNDIREILVFKHPSAGIQLPAGTVEPGEDIEVAVLREAHEETGIQTFHLRTRLGMMENELEPGECIIAKTVHVRLEPDEKAMPYEYAFGRGATVRYHESTQGWSRISYIEYDRWPDPQHIRLNITGWVPDDAVSHRKPRYFFHLTTPEQTPDRWALESDGGRIFEPFWAPLSPRPSLIPPQDRWLDAVYDQLINTQTLSDISSRE